MTVVRKNEQIVDLIRKRYESDNSLHNNKFIIEKMKEFGFSDKQIEEHLKSIKKN